ncbi:hypothetical protein MNEG_1703 [Monoraphidium neglectum]|uniref:MYND-type domain-containing protein n=1 Tax=Monoraphidium neglectum TaxID=145388 RepID=A0A0D2K7Q5_9CHLO|nr:hypothetical protein MNEG_1703 [Monoraphidium neglectum]KIZ06258.1 hypothetical protein MNEG_1703 [Monoraphidium neglectum]|eukprot:XP_013905277.1 hypothetical protein MNEG_1703 [Monoraphidium neglectum]
MRCAAAEAALLLLYCAEDAAHGPAERQQLARPAWHSLISEATSFGGRGPGPEAARSHFLQAALACSPACLPDLAAHPGALTVAAAAAVCAPPRYGAAGQGLELLEQLAACAWRDQGGAEGQDGVVNSSIGTTSWSKLDEQALALVHPTFDAKARDALRMLERHPDGRIAASARDAHAMLVGAQLDVFGLVRDERTGDDRLQNAQQRPISGVGGAVAAAAAAAAPAPAASGSQPEGREAQDALEEQDQQLGADGSVSAGAPAPEAAAPVGQRRASQPRRACATCGKAAGEDGVKLQRCSGCDAARYCGKECAKAGWKAGHREECKAAQLKKQQAKAGQE